MFHPHLTRPLGLAAGVLLAASALAVPAGAAASTSVEAERMPEGNKGLTESYTRAHVNCDIQVGTCEFEAHFVAGTAIGFADFGFDPPKTVTLEAGESAEI